MLLKHLSWIGKIVKNLWNVAKKFTFLVGLGKIFGRSVKNFSRPGQGSGKKLEMSGKKFRKKCMGKNPGGQKFWQRGGQGRFSEILSCPPHPKCVLPLKCPPKFRDLVPSLYLRLIFHVKTPYTSYQLLVLVITMWCMCIIIITTIITIIVSMHDL